MVYWLDLHLNLMQRTLTLLRSRSLAYFNLGVVDVRQQLVEVAHVGPFAAARALHEMICLGFPCVRPLISAHLIFVPIDQLTDARLGQYSANYMMPNIISTGRSMAASYISGESA
jgi:hypothetical protein